MRREKKGARKETPFPAPRSPKAGRPPQMAVAPPRAHAAVKKDTMIP